MRKLALEDKKELRLSDLNDNSIVGIKFYAGKNYIIQERSGEFISLNVNENSISGSTFSEPTLLDYVKRIKKQDPEIYVFDTMKELFKWMSE